MEGMYMKKMKKLVSFLMSGLLVLAPILMTSQTALAYTSLATVNCSLDWYDYDTGDYTTTAVVMSVAGDNHTYLIYAYHETDGDGDYEWYWGEVDECFDYFYPGETIAVYLPFSVDMSKVDYFYYYNSCFEFELAAPNCIVFTCIDSTNECYFEVGLFKSAVEDQFWFIPMKTQLNIAAEVASQSGKEAIAYAEGDFALSYGIMKFLEDHPNVTLQYKMTYKGEEHNIVIKGGQKLAFADIPWYGPEYLIGKFKK